MIEVIMDGSEFRLVDGDKPIPKKKWIKVVRDSLGNDNSYEGSKLLQELTNRIAEQQKK